MFSYDRYLHFRETDAAGVLYFSEVLNLCHEAYEASLRTVGLDLKLFFRGTETTIVPIVHAAVDFSAPLLWRSNLGGSQAPVAGGAD